MTEILPLPFPIVNRHKDALERAVMSLYPEHLRLDRLLDELKDQADEGTYIHSLETAFVVHRLAIFLELSEHDCTLLACGAGLHDIAKKDPDIKAVINIPDELTATQRRLVAEHPLRGQQYVEYHLTRDLSLSQFAGDIETIVTIIGFHHDVDGVKDTRLRNLVELVHLVDRGLALSDVNRSYLRAFGAVQSADAAFKQVAEEEIQAGRGQKTYFGCSIEELCDAASYLADDARSD